MCLREPGAATIEAKSHLEISHYRWARCARSRIRLSPAASLYSGYPEFHECSVERDQPGRRAAQLERSK